MSPFDLFSNDPYTFLEIDQTIRGNTVVEEYEAEGIIKLRDGMTQVDNMENFESTSTLHIKPSETFVGVVGGNMVGHGVRLSKGNHTAADYRIEGQVEGFDFDTGELLFYRVTLKREDISPSPSSLPLE